MSHLTSDEDAVLRVWQALNKHLKPALFALVSGQMTARHGDNWRNYATRSRGYASEQLDSYALLKTIVDNWQDTFRSAFERNHQHRAYAFITQVLEARNVWAHEGEITDAAALRYLDGMHELAVCMNAAADCIAELKSLYDAQRGAGLAPRPREQPSRSISVRNSAAKRGQHEDFYEWLLAAKSMSPGSARSYVSYINSVEHALETRLDDVDLDGSRLIQVESQLRALRNETGQSKIDVGNWISGLRAFATFRRAARNRSQQVDDVRLDFPAAGSTATGRSAEAERLWSELGSLLTPGQEVSGWGAVRGYTDTRFRIADIGPTFMLVRSPSTSQERRISKTEFVTLIEIWDDYCAGRIGRAEISKLSHNTSYIFAILRHHADVTAGR